MSVSLSTPLKIGNKAAPNRIVAQPMECNNADADGNPTDLTFERYRRLAEGEWGILTFEALTVAYESRARKNQLGIAEKNREGLGKLVESIRAIDDETLIIFQINHSGNISNGTFSRVVSPYPTGDPGVYVLTDDDLEEIKEQFATAARIAYEAGADGIDFKMCHGYLLGQLLRPANTREGRYGGSFENRTRFFVETTQAIQKAVNDPDFLLGTRVSFYEGIIGGFGTTGPDEVAEDDTEPLTLMRMIEEMGYHFINVSAGIPVMTPQITRPTNHCPEGVFRHMAWTKKVKETVKIPVIGSAYSYLRDGANDLKEAVTGRKDFVTLAERNIERGYVDMVGVGRQSLADPFFPRKILNGKTDEIRYCKICGGCASLLRGQGKVGCAFYDSFYKEELKRIRKKKS
ncbi:MAG: NADH:flavin oxidoreductase [Deltaproteobacteria bacterium]|nr:NADH:flavin oxidoreductase [Deltaproteobacteria bacterium]